MKITTETAVLPHSETDSWEVINKIYFRTIRGVMLKTIAKSIASVADYAIIKRINAGEIEYWFLDESNICFGIYHILPEFWENMEIGAIEPENSFWNFEDISEVFTKSKIAPNLIELSYVEKAKKGTPTKEQFEILIEGSESREFSEIAYSTPKDDKILDVKDIDLAFSNEIRMKSETLKKSLGIFPVGNKKKPQFEVIEAELTPDLLKFSSESQTQKKQSEILLDKVLFAEVKEPCHNFFSNNFVQRILEIVPFSSQVIFQMQAECPLCVQFTLNDRVSKKFLSDNSLGWAKYWLACRVEEEKPNGDA